MAHLNPLIVMPTSISRAVRESAKSLAVTVLSALFVACGGSNAPTNSPTDPGAGANDQIAVVLVGSLPIVYSPYDRALFSEFFPSTWVFSLRKGNASITQIVTWSSSDAHVIQISDLGIATATGPGSASIVAAYQGKSYNFPVTVLSTVTSLSLSGITTYSYSAASTKVQTGKLDATAKLTQQFRPTIIFDPDASDKVQWQSSNTSVATVSSIGIVSALNVGTVVITATLPGQQATIPISVSGASFNLTGTYKDGVKTFTLTQTANSLSGVGTGVPYDSFRNRTTMGVSGNVSGATVTMLLNDQSPLCPATTMTVTSATGSNIVGTFSGPACQLSSSYSYPFNLVKQ